MFREGLGRKFFACMFMQITNIILVAFKFIDSGDFTTMTIGVFGAFVLGNMGSKFAAGVDLSIKPKKVKKVQ